ncbi:MAG: hypothetical protein P4L42_09895 [Desulfocapsaceae bacterium]|nr:hypothetical protein [Desulfocapsaceae bacterium]
MIVILMPESGREAENDRRNPFMFYVVPGAAIRTRPVPVAVVRTPPESLLKDKIPFNIRGDIDVRPGTMTNCGGAGITRGGGRGKTTSALAAGTTLPDGATTQPWLLNPAPARRIIAAPMRYDRLKAIVFSLYVV